VRWPGDISSRNKHPFRNKVRRKQCRILEVSQGFEKHWSDRRSCPAALSYHVPSSWQHWQPLRGSPRGGGALGLVGTRRLVGRPWRESEGEERQARGESHSRAWDLVGANRARFHYPRSPHRSRVVVGIVAERGTGQVRNRRSRFIEPRPRAFPRKSGVRRRAERVRRSRRSRESRSHERRSQLRARRRRGDFALHERVDVPARSGRRSLTCFTRNWSLLARQFGD